MEIIIWILFGALVGWVTSLIMKTASREGVIIKVAVGILGALFGGWLMSTVEQGHAADLSIFSFGVVLAGAVVLIAGVKIIRS